MIYSFGDCSNRESDEMKILIVDDDPSMRETIKELVEADDHRAELAEDGAQALSILERSEEVQLVISDYQMPRLDGLRLLSALRAKSETRTSPFLLMSGSQSHANGTLLAEVCSQQNAHYAPKPVLEINEHIEKACALASL